MSAGALREVIASFSVDTSGADSKVRSLAGALSGVTKTLGALADAFVGSAIVHGLSEFIESQISAGSAVNDLAERLGVGTDELQAFQFAAGLAGVGAEEAGKALEQLNRHVGEALSGNKGAAEAFAGLGIALKDSSGSVRETGDLIPELADAFADMGSDAERTAAAMKIFGKSGASLLPFLKGGSKGAREMLAEFNRLGGGMSKEFVAAADVAGDEIDKVKFAFNGWKSQITFAILPAVTHLAKWLQGSIGMLRRVTKETTIAKQAWVLFGVGSAAATAKAATGFAKMLGVIPKDAGFWKTLLGLGEIGLVIAGVALLYLAFEDFFTFLRGGESVIGDVIDGLFGVGTSKEVIDEVHRAFSEFKTELQAFGPLASEVGRLFADGWQLVRPILIAIEKDDLKRMARGLVAILKIVHAVVEEIAAGMQLVGRFGMTLGNFMSKMGLDGEGVTRLSRALAATGVNVEHAAIRPHGTENTAWIPQQRRGLESETVHQTAHVTNNIHGVKDAAAVGEAASKGTRDAFDEWQTIELSDAAAVGY